MLKLFLIFLAATVAFTWLLCTLADMAIGETLPVSEKGKIIVFQSSSMRCALYINENGTTHGTSSLACVDLPWDEAIDNRIRILDVSPTEKSKD
jgi:hypothetical protein